MNLESLFISFFIITLAELGDKTQLLTLGLATKFRPPIVFCGICVASAVLMGIAVVFGGTINKLFPLFYLQFLAGMLFIIFGLWAFLNKEKDESIALSNNTKNHFFVVFSAFFVSELGDKTQLATFALSAKYGTPLETWVGATLAMIFVNLIAILLGSWFKKFISHTLLKFTGATVFLIFGVLFILQLFLKL